MKVRPLSAKNTAKLKALGLTEAYKKKVILFENNPRHTSLHYEILKSTRRFVPPTRSFRINIKYRVLGIEIGKEFQPHAITNHYED